MRDGFRAFIALPLPDPVRQRVSRIAAPLKSSGADVGWVRPEHLHLTLKFLGDISEAQRTAMEAGLETVAAETAGIPLSLGEVGAFPSVRAPRILWVGVRSGAAAVADLARRVEEAAAAARIPAESRPYSAHITLGRIRSGRGQAALVESLRNISGQPDVAAEGTEWTAEAMRMYRSDLSSAGPSYTVLKEWTFTRAAS